MLVKETNEMSHKTALVISQTANGSLNIVIG